VPVVGGGADLDLYEKGVAEIPCATVWSLGAGKDAAPNAHELAWPVEFPGEVVSGDGVPQCMESDHIREFGKSVDLCAADGPAGGADECGIRLDEGVDTVEFLKETPRGLLHRAKVPGCLETLQIARIFS